MGTGSYDRNVISGFRSTGIIPFNPDAIPKYAFLISPSDQQQENNERRENRSTSPQPSCSHWQETPIPSEEATAEVENDQGLEHRQASPQLSCSQRAENPQKNMHALSETTDLTSTVATEEPPITPGKLLDHISPIPILSKVASARKNSRALAEILNSPANILHLRNRKRQNKTPESVKCGANVNRKAKGKTITRETKRNAKKKQSKKRKAPTTDTESDSSLDIHFQDDDDDEDDEESCVGCGELYSCTKKVVDWIKCISCQLWLHENCSKYESMCDICGKKQNK